MKNFDWRLRSLDWKKKGFLAVAVLSVAQQTWRIFFLVVVRRLFLAGQEFVLTPSQI